MMMRMEYRRVVLLSVWWIFSPISLTARGESVRHVIAEPGTTEVKTLPQNWSDLEASWFYNVPQGSYLFRYDWFLNLEQAESEALFRDDANIQSLGYLARSADSDNPGGLPIGFVKDDKELGNGRTESYLGLTCAACHTGYVNFDHKTYLIDGAPANGNLEKLLRSLVSAIQSTLDNQEKFDRFADKVLGEGAVAGESARLRTELADALNARIAYNTRNLPSENATPFGPGRIDAFGAIMNEVAERFAQVPDNHAPADAPVSYPALWDTPQHDFVQWNGAAENKRSFLVKSLVGTDRIGALGRNTGEVFGVFGEIDASVEPSIIDLKHYPNSANRKNLIEIEESLSKLWSPAWPADFPAIDHAMKTRGARLFEDNCASCHEPIVRIDPDREVTARMSDEHTDATMARNFLSREAKTGVLQGRRIEPLSRNHERFGSTAPVGLMLKHLVQRAIIRSSAEVLDQGREHVAEMFQQVQATVDYQVSGAVSTPGEGAGTSPGRFGFEADGVAKVRDFNGRVLRLAETRLNRVLNREDRIKVNYKARPLNGIWASAPYLHNGSIPNLDELLKKPHQRSQEPFQVGSRDFDPVKVGFQTDVGEVFNPQLKGNLNVGHDYGHDDGTPFTDNERKFLIEYMKSL